MNGLCDSCGAAEEDCRECKIKSKRKKNIGEKERMSNMNLYQINAEIMKAFEEAVKYSGNVTDLPAEFVKSAEPTVDKVALKKALKAGEEIQGASLVKHQNMQIK